MSKALSITITDDQYDEVQNIMQEEGYKNRSEFFRAVLRQFRSNRIPVVEPTQEEIAIFERSDRELANGQYVTLDELEREVGIIR